MKKIFLTRYSAIILLLFAAVIMFQNCNSHTDRETSEGDSYNEGPNPETIWAKFDSLCTNNDGQPAFTTFIGNYDLFLLPAGINPPGWDSKVADLNTSRMKRWQQLSDSGKLLNKNGEKISLAYIKNPGEWLVLDEFIEAGLKGRPHVPAIDQNGRYIHSAVFYNKVLYNYIANNKLYDSNALTKILQAPDTYVADKIINKINAVDVVFPEGNKPDTNSTSYRLNAPNGSMMIKTSWKVLGKNDAASEFITSKALIIFENHNAPVPFTYADTVTVGLVGFHMVYKDADNPNWVWSTFEQINNVPPATDRSNKNKKYNFYKAASPLQDLIENPRVTNTDSCCLANNSLECNGQSNTIYEWYNPFKTGQSPTNIWRLDTLLAVTTAVNEKLKGNHKNPVLDNYFLIGTEWATNVGKGAKNDTLHITPTQQRLANSTLESFEQLNASCMGCHNLTTGILNDPLQKITTNVNYSAISLREYPAGQKYPSRYLYADFMYSSQKIQLAGHLSWYQVRPDICK